MTLGHRPESGHSENRKSKIGYTEDGYFENGYSETGGRARAGKPQWHLCVEEDGQLIAVLTGSEPSITVSGDSLATLRRRMRNVVLRGLL